MLCQECKKNKAVYFYSENINGKTYSVALCEDCKKRIMNKESEFPSESGYNVFDSFLFPSPFSFQGQDIKIAREKRCERCRSSFDELLRGKRSFCPECYDVFHDELSSLLINIHGSDKHIGKRPVHSIDAEAVTALKKEEDKSTDTVISDPLSSLKADLKLAIQDERYEDAARIRDEIKKKEEEK